MSNASLKEQLQAMASQLSESVIRTAPDRSVGRASARREPSAKAPVKSSRPMDRKPKPAAPKPKWLELAQYGVALLRSYFPGAFKPMNQVQPLKKGIKEDLVQRLSTMEKITTDDKACMVKSLSFYVNTVAYHRLVIEGASRLDLDGQPAGVVTAEEARYSQEKMKHKKEKKSAPTAGSSSTPTSTSEPSSPETSADGKETT